MREHLCEVNEGMLVWGSPQTWDWVCHFIKFPWSTCKEQDPGYIHSDCSWDVSWGDRWAVWRAQGAAETASWDWGTGCGNNWALVEGNEPLLHKVQLWACLQVSSSGCYRCLTYDLKHDVLEVYAWSLGKQARCSHPYGSVGDQLSMCTSRYLKSHSINEFIPSALGKSYSFLCVVLLTTIQNKLRNTMGGTNPLYFRIWMGGKC